MHSERQERTKSHDRLHFGWHLTGKFDAEDVFGLPGALLSLPEVFHPRHLDETYVAKTVTGNFKKRSVQPEKFLESLIERDEWNSHAASLQGQTWLEGRQSKVEIAFFSNSFYLMWQGGWAQDGPTETLASEALTKTIDVLQSHIDWRAAPSVLPHLGMAKPYHLLPAPDMTEWDLAWSSSEPLCGPGPLADWSWLNRLAVPEEALDRVAEYYERVLEPTGYDYRPGTFAGPKWLGDLVGAGQDRRLFSLVWKGDLAPADPPEAWTVDTVDTDEAGGEIWLRAAEPYGLADQQAADRLSAWFAATCQHSNSRCEWALGTPLPASPSDIVEAARAATRTDQTPPFAAWLTAGRFVADNAVPLNNDLVFVRHGVGPYPSRSQLDLTQQSFAQPGTSKPLDLGPLERLLLPPSIESTPEGRT